MRDKMGLFLMEDAGGGVAVQLFAEPDSAEAAFAELKGRPGEPPRRATFMKVVWSGSGVAVEAETRDLPAPLAEAPERYVVGDGAVAPKEGG